MRKWGEPKEFTSIIKELRDLSSKFAQCEVRLGSSTGNLLLTYPFSENDLQNIQVPPLDSREARYDEIVYSFYVLQSGGGEAEVTAKVSYRTT